MSRYCQSKRNHTHHIKNTTSLELVTYKFKNKLADVILKQPLFGISFEQTIRYLYDDIERWNTPERTYITQHTRVSDPSRCVVPLNLQTGSIVTNRVDYGPWFRRLPSSPPVIGINGPIRKNRLRIFFFFWVRIFVVFFALYTLSFTSLVWSCLYLLFSRQFALSGSPLLNVSLFLTLLDTPTTSWLLWLAPAAAYARETSEISRCAASTEFGSVQSVLFWVKV